MIRRKRIKKHVTGQGKDRNRTENRTTNKLEKANN